jgi:hypothetical protein
MNVARLAGAKICQECDHVFTVRELKAESTALWGHPCFGTKDGGAKGLRVRCESFREELTTTLDAPPPAD